jgi:hypothetical protein
MVPFQFMRFGKRLVNLTQVAAIELEAKGIDWNRESPGMESRPLESCVRIWMAVPEGGDGAPDRPFMLDFFDDEAAALRRHFTSRYYPDATTEAQPT